MLGQPTATPRPSSEPALGLPVWTAGHPGSALSKSAPTGQKGLEAGLGSNAHGRSQLPPTQPWVLAHLRALALPLSITKTPSSPSPPPMVREPPLWGKCHLPWETSLTPPPVLSKAWANTQAALAPREQTPGPLPALP